MRGAGLAGAAGCALLLAAGAVLAQTGYDPMAAMRGGDEEAGSARPVPSDAFGGLPDAPGAEATYYQCVACHSTEIIKQQRLSDARWEYLWGWMIEEQGMPEADPETKAEILGYLTTYFSSER